MTFSQKIKLEITKNQYRDIDLKCLLSAFLKNNVAINLDSKKITWEIKVKNNSIIRFITTSLMKLYPIKKQISFSKAILDNATRYKLEIEGNLDFIEKDLCLFSNPNDLFVDDDARHSYLTGAFLSGGSINNPSSSNYHFEIAIHNSDLLNDLISIFDSLNIKTNILERNNHFKLYVKKSESISDFLKYINANESMFEYESKRIYRDYSNQMQRLNNLDVCNLKKTVDAASKQIEWINEIKKNKLIYDSLSSKEKKFCNLRLNHPDSNLSELVVLFMDIYNIQVTRTGLNHYVRKIKNVYNKIKGE